MVPEGELKGQPFQAFHIEIVDKLNNSHSFLKFSILEFQEVVLRRFRLVVFSKTLSCTRTKTGASQFIEILKSRSAS